MASLECPHCGELIDLPGTDAFDDSPLAAVPVLGRVPFAPAINGATNSGRPILLAAPQSPTARVFRAVAAAVDVNLRS